MAPKVEIGTTLQGTVVTGTHVDPTARVTGSEAGACLTVTGTEYAGSEQYAELCDTTPVPGVAKVGVGSTRRGQRVTGTEIGRSDKVTGDEHGACALVTGTEYLGADKLEYFCGVAPEEASVDGAESRTRDGHVVTGTEVGRSPKVTGDEPGACQKLTGTQYVSSTLTESLCGARVARKVGVTTTGRGQAVTGTEVGHSPKVTGDYHGACASVTGTQYVGLEQYQACNRAPVAAPAKVGVMATWRGQQVSGTAVERSAKVTGDEHGACQPVSGDQYVGPDQYAQYCDPLDAEIAQARQSGSAPGRSIIPSGTRTDGGTRVTGTHRGAAITVSGTPYAGGVGEQPPAPGGRLAPPAPRQAAPEPVPAAWQPQRSTENGLLSRPGRDRSVARITGTAYGGGRRITGPVDRAEGLVSGTPEFRYREDGASGPADAQAPEYRPSRVTGEGRVMGFTVTGAAWRPNGVVTGTEGASARRNPTLRGEPREVVRGSEPDRVAERAEVPVSRVTGSSGNSASGATVTYSGGARG